MSVPDQAAVKLIINSEIRKKIVSVFLGAWKDWRESPCASVWRYNRERATYVSAQIIYRACQAFSYMDDVHVHFIEKHETMKFLIRAPNGESVLFRLKKADEFGRTSNIPTQQVLAFHNHEPEIQNLFDFPEAYRVDIVYKLDKFETSIQDICVVARDGDEIVWEYSLLEAGDVSTPLPTPEPKPMRPATKEIVRLKGAPRERKPRDK